MLAPTFATAEVAVREVQVEGLSAPAEILIDRWGVPHIYAAEHYDAFFVQGFNAARDRLWQIDTWRRRGLGLLAEVFGADFVAQDRAARLFLYRGDMHREWLAYGSDAKRIAQAFVAGINAYVRLTRADPTLLPVEFTALKYQPALWSATDVVRIRSHGLWRNLTSEVARAQILCRFPNSVDGLHKHLEPSWQPIRPVGLDLCSIPAGVFDDYLLAKAPVAFPPGRALSLARSIDQRVDIGSNNWAIAPTRTATGRPILANDPHRAHALPSLRYVAQLVAPGLNVIGAGEPALPGISIGHNERIAFGLTIFPIDQEDLYVYETRAVASHQYRYRGRWEPMQEVVETIPVRGAAPVTVVLRFTRHGPVLREDPAAHRAYAARVAWLEPGMAPYFGSIEYMRAQNWRQFDAALNRWGAPSENQVYADVDGNIGYQPAGLFPRRHNWDGLLPVPGDGRYEWDGYFDVDALPRQFNPARGFVATANAMNLPADYPIDERRIGFEWSAPWRARRIDEVLAQQPQHTLADSLALQRDYTSLLAREVVARLPAGDSPALSMLRGWNGLLAADSAAAALFEVWYTRHLGQALAVQFAPSGAAPLITPLDSLAVLDLLDRPSPELRGLLLATLDAAWAETAQLLGSDPAVWQWGKLHQTRFEHPLGVRIGSTWALPRYPRGGDGNSPNNTGFDSGDFDVASGASWRMVVDVGSWDEARMTNAPGQSGDPRSPFYDNLLEGWANDESVPLLYTRAAVERELHEVIRLIPVRSQPASVAPN